MPFERYKADIDKLVQRAAMLSLAMYLDVYPDQFKKKLNAEQLKKIPKFTEAYQSWYSEALACVSQLLPNRREDFVSYYKPLKTRKSLDSENYTVSDYLRGLSADRGPQKVVGPAAALEPFAQQVKIVEALKQRFESSLFDIRALVQADLFDNELYAATELSNKGFQRAAGAVVGVVLEEHLATVCAQHEISTPKNATISKLNDLLKLFIEVAELEPCELDIPITLPFRADHVGSLLRPPELLRARAEHQPGRVSAEELRRIEDEAIRDVVRMQQEIGLEGVTDGEFRPRFVIPGRPARGSRAKHAPPNDPTNDELFS